MRRQKPYVKLLLADDTVETIADGVAVQIVEDEWYVRNQLGVNV